MKKNKWMRLAALMLVLCMITTCAVSGTYAKYVTSDSAVDTARVAKFGVVAKIDGALFGATYDKHDGGTTPDKIISYGVNTESVSSIDAADLVVAPGTIGDEMKLTVFGTPEVSTQVTFGDAYDANGVPLKAYDSDIVLAAGKYGVMVEWTGIKTKENVVGKYELDASGNYAPISTAPSTVPDKVFVLKDAADTSLYYPLIWSWATGTSTTQALGTPTDHTKNLADAKAAIATFFAKPENSKFVPNKKIDLGATLTWQWKYVDGDVLTGSTLPYYTYDKADTILGDMIAEAKSADAINGDVVVQQPISSKNVYVPLKYATVPVVATDSSTSAIIAFTGTKPDVVPKLGEALPDGLYAILTVNVQASLTCTQVD